MRVVVHTGPADRAAHFVEVLNAAGFEVRGLPAIATEPVEPSPGELAAIASAAPFGLVVVTSARAAAALPRFAAWIGGAAVAAVGSATADACAQAGFAATWIGAASRRPFLEALAGRADLTGRNVLHPRGNLGDDGLLPELAGRAGRVVAPIVYRTDAVPHLPDAVRAALRGAAGVTFTSPSGVRSFCASADAAEAGAQARATFAATIGPTTETAARRAGFSWCGIARRADPDGIAALLRSATM